MAPIALSFAAQYGISPLLMGLMVVHGAQAGGFSPSSIYGGITNRVVERAGLPLSQATTFLASLGVNTAVAALLFVVLGRGLLARRTSSPNGGAVLPTAEPAVTGVGAAAMTRRHAATGHSSGDPARDREQASLQAGAQTYGDAEWEAESEHRPRAVATAAAAAPGGDTSRGGVTPYRLLTVVGLFALAVLTPLYDLSSTEVGFVAISIGLLLGMLSPQAQKRATGQVTWPEILLITGVATYVAVLQEMRTIGYVGNSVAGIGSALLAALLLCFIGAIVSAFASSVAVLGSLIPLAVPFLQSGAGVSATGFVAALAVASTIVDVSPFSTNGALVLANAHGVDPDRFFRQLLAYGALVTAVAPIVVWLIFVVL